MNDLEFIEFLCRQIKLMNEDGHNPDIKTIVIELKKRNVKFDDLFREDIYSGEVK